MEADQHRRELLAVGSAIFIGGVIVMAEWSFSVLAAAPQNNLHFVNLILIVPGALIVAGFYIMIAAHVPSNPLFGRKRVRQAMERREKADYYLAYFHYIGSNYALGRDGVTAHKVVDWHNRMREFVIAAWGPTEGSALSAVPDETDAVTTAVNMTKRVTNLTERTHLKPILESFSLEPVPQWKTYVDEWVENLVPDE